MSVVFELSQFPSSQSGLSFSLCTSQSALVLLLLLTRVSVALESHSQSALIISKACGLFATSWGFFPPFSAVFAWLYFHQNTIWDFQAYDEK